MDRSESITALAGALAKAQKAIKPAVKDGKLTTKSYTVHYAGLPSVWDAIRGPLTDNGLSIVQLPADAQPGWCTLVTTLLHESGEYISSTFSLRVGGDGPQAYGSALTYMRRYALAAMVGVVADDDDDGQQAQPSHTPRQQPVARQQSQKPKQQPATKQEPPEPPKNSTETIVGALIGTKPITVGEQAALEITLDVGEDLNDETALIYAKAGTAPAKIADLAPGTAVSALCVVTEKGTWWVKSYEVVEEAETTAAAA